MSEAKKNVERTRHIFEEMARLGSNQPLLEAMDEEAVYKLSLPKGTPLSGEFRGRQAILEYFERLEQVLEVQEVNTWDFVGNGDQVIVLGDEHFVVKKTGRTCYSEFAFVLDFRAGKIVRALVIEDLSGVVEAFAPASARAASRASGT
ncbi:nuclear transport factor 2 family protein [Archangium gephyra]|uniref:nuclear transport factor 2 family protein n=1 Tax=Archangium gephyra TaxID=48 RepID=UPI0035D43AA2